MIGNHGIADPLLGGQMTNPNTLAVTAETTEQPRPTILNTEQIPPHPSPNNRIRFQQYPRRPSSSPGPGRGQRSSFPPAYRCNTYLP